MINFRTAKCSIEQSYHEISSPNFVAKKHFYKLMTKLQFYVAKVRD